MQGAKAKRKDNFLMLTFIPSVVTCNSLHMQPLILLYLCSNAHYFCKMRSQDSNECCIKISGHGKKLKGKALEVSIGKKARRSKCRWKKIYIDWCFALKTFRNESHGEPNLETRRLKVLYLICLTGSEKKGPFIAWEAECWTQRRGDINILRRCSWCVGITLA